MHIIHKKYALTSLLCALLLGLTAAETAHERVLRRLAAGSTRRRLPDAKKQSTADKNASDIYLNSTKATRRSSRSHESSSTSVEEADARIKAGMTPSEALRAQLSVRAGETRSAVL